MRFKKKSSQQDYSSYGYGAAYEPTEVLPQTEALRQYRLNKDDLKPLRVKLATNPVDPRYAPMKLYRVADLQVRSGSGSALAAGSNEGPCTLAPIAAHARWYRSGQQREGADDDYPRRCVHRPARLRRAYARAWSTAEA